MGESRKDQHSLQERSWSGSDSKAQMGAWEALLCILLITVWISLGSKVSKTYHVWNLFMLLYEGEQFLIVLPYLIVNFSIRNSSDLFYSKQLLVINVLGTVLLLYPPVQRPALLKRV